jgi:signal transduction histidine kinase
MKLIRRGLMTKLLGYFLMSSLIPIFIVGYMAYDSGQRAIEKQTSQYLLITANLRAEELERWVSVEEIEVQLLAGSAPFQRSAQRIVTRGEADPVYKRSHEEIINYFRKAQKEDEHFREVSFISPEGVVLVSTNPARRGENLLEETYFIKGTISTHASKIGNSGMVITSPVRSEEGSLLGVVMVNFDLQRVREIMEKRTGLGETGETYLVDKNYRFVTNPKHREEGLLKKEVRTRGVEECLKGVSGVGLYKNYDGKPVIGAYRWLDQQGLCLVAEIEQKEAFAQIFNLKNAIFKVGMVVTAVIVLVVVFISRSITLPIHDLMKGAERIGRGDLEHRIDIPSKDEIGVLAQSFNSMVKNLSETQRKLIQSEKLASIGQLAAGVAHELNNPLANISLNAQMLMRSCKDEITAKKLRVIEENVTGAAKIIRDLLDFSREPKLELEYIDINEILEKTLESLKYKIGGIKLVKNLSPVPRVLGDRVRLRQVFTNLITNAVQAMEGDGTLTLATRTRGGWVEVVVRDTGKGIPPEHLNKIFDPFFTTKGVGKGTGLGLAITYGIVQKHRGLIDVESEVGKGTTFTVRIPSAGGRKHEEDFSR